MIQHSKLSIFLLLLVFSVVLNPLQAQTINLDCPNSDPNDQPCFDILLDTDGDGNKEPVSGIVRICVGTEIEVVPCSSFGCELSTVSYIFAEGLGATTSNLHTYTEAGIYSITQQAGGCLGTGCTIEKVDVIEVLPVPTPVFEVKRCAEHFVALTIPSDAEENLYDEYYIDWGDGTPIETVAAAASINVQHQYTTSGSFSIKVSGNYLGANCGGSSQSALLVNPIPEISRANFTQVNHFVQGQANGAISLRFDAQRDFNYQIWITEAGGTFNLLEEIAGEDGSIERSYDNLNTELNHYCFKITTLDQCGNQLETEEFYCSMNISAAAVTGSDREVQINWTPYPPTLPAGLFQQYILYRDNQAIAVFNDLNIQSYIDDNVNCNQEYCYQVRALLTSSSLNVNFLSLSNTACAVGSSAVSPPGVSQLNSSVINSRSIGLTWEVPNDPRIVEYQVLRDGQLLQSFSGTQNAIETELNLDRQYCYSLRYVNECEQVSPEVARTCPVYLRVIRTDAGRPRLIWTSYENSTNSFQQYVVQKLDEEGNVYDESTVLSALSTSFDDFAALNDRQIMRYRIKTVINEAEELYSYSNIAEIAQDFRLFFPNAFSPNGDGINDIFRPKGLFVDTYLLRIYDRSGNELFRSENPEDGWNGEFKGKTAPSDTYIYVLEMKDFRGQSFKGKGSFTLINR